MEYLTSDFARCAECDHYVPSDSLADLDGDGARYCPTCLDALWRLMAAEWQQQAPELHRNPNARA